MKARIRILALAAVILVAQVSLPLAATFVQQRFRFLALTTSWEGPGRPCYVVWIVEDRSGEGNSSTLVQVVLASDRPPALLQTDLRTYGDWQWLREGASKFWTEQFRVLPESQGVFSSDDYSILIQSPVPSDSLRQAFRDFIGQGHTGARDWNDVMEPGGFDPPRVSGTDWDLVYYYPDGLYINYEIADAYYFSRTRHLILFTHQDILATGMDTMHGFMILRLNLDDE